MNIWKWETRYDPTTGEEADAEPVLHCVVCDATGRRLDTGLYKSCQYELQPGGLDLDVGGVDGEQKLRDEYGIELYLFISDPYVFVDDWNEYVDGIIGEDEFVRQFVGLGVSLHEALREARAATALRLLDERLIEPNQLTGGPPKEH